MTTWWCELAVLPGGRVASDVRLEEADGRITAVTEGAPADGERLGGLVVPGLANSHSHAFHRALRGRTQRAGQPGAAGSFWTWRRQMYAVAERLDPDSYLRLATACYAEMALAGVTCVGEFHYLHHQAGGRPYDDPHVMSRALAEAADAAGIRVTLLDACYLAGGIDVPLEGVQLRFGDGRVQDWAARVLDVADAVTGEHVWHGVAAHSVRAVPAADLPVVAEAAVGSPLHVHVSEQPVENEQCLAAYGRTPTQVLHGAGVLGPRSTAVHATHLTGEDVRLLGSSGTSVCMCPTTERDLADGIGPARELRDAGSPLTLGSDSHAVVDLLEEARAVELDERLASGLRGSWLGAALLDAATTAGQASLGWDDAGRIEVGARADLVAVDLGSVRTAGGSAADAVDRVVFAATASDVTDVVVGGRRVVTSRQHVLGDVGRLLADAVDAVLG